MAILDFFTGGPLVISDHDKRKTLNCSDLMHDAADSAAMAGVCVQAGLQGAAGLRRHVHDHQYHLQEHTIYTLYI